MANKFRVGRVSFTCIMLFFLMGLLVWSPVEAKYGVSPENLTWAYGGQTVSIPIYVDDIGGLEAWDLIIKFDPNVLSFSSVEYTNLSAQYYFIQANFDPDVGGVKVGAFLYFDNAGIVAPPPDGTGGALFNAVFQVTDQVPAATDISILVIEDTGDQLQVVGTSGVFYGETVHYEVTFLNKYINTLENTSFHIPIHINSTMDLQHWHLELIYNPDVLQFKDYLLLTPLTEQYDYLEFNEESPGLVKVSAIKLQEAIVGSGVFFKFRFQAKKKGTSAISLQYVNDKGNQFGSVAPSTGQVRVTKPVTKPVVPPYWTFPGFPLYSTYLTYPMYPMNLPYSIFSSYFKFPSYPSYPSYPAAYPAYSMLQTFYGSPAYPAYSMFQKFFGLPVYPAYTLPNFYQSYSQFGFGGFNPF